MRHHCHQAALLLAALGAGAGAGADTAITFEGSGDQPDRIYVRGDKVRMDTGARETLIYDAASATLTMLDHAQRSQLSLSEQSLAQMQSGRQAQMQQMQQQMGAAMEQLREQLEAVLADPNLDETQKNAIRQQMQRFGAAPRDPGAAAPPRLSSRDSGRRLTLAGIPCRIHQLLEDGTPVREVCVASAPDAGVPDDDYRTLRGMFAFLRGMAQRSAAAFGARGAAMPDLEGVPLQSRDLRRGTTSTLRSIVTERLAADLFAIPAGYRRSDPLGGLGGG